VHPHTSDSISTPQKLEKLPDSPSGPVKWTPDMPDSCRSHVDALRVFTDMQSVAHDMITTANTSEAISKC